MAAVLARGETIIGNAACEPHVQDLCRFLVSLGAEIEGIGSNVLRIRGVERLHGGEWRICPDHIEVASFVGLGAVTEGEIMIEDVHAEDLVAVWPGFERLGVVAEVEGTSVRVQGGQELVVRDDLGSQIPKIEDGPWPQFPADLTSIALAVATQAQGTVLDLREDVREPPVLRGQAREHGRADHPLRPASRGRERARRSSTASGWRARTSAREWRC